MDPCVISYDTTTFADFSYFVAQQSRALARIEPQDFMSLVELGSCYLNLVIRDPSLRAAVRHRMDMISCPRFSWVHGRATVDGYLGLGSLLFPGVTIYPHATVGADCILHANSTVGHNAVLGHGCFVSGSVTVCGGSVVGDDCWLGTGTTVLDGITVCPNVVIGAGSMVSHDITEPGTYAYTGRKLVRTRSPAGH